MKWNIQKKNQLKRRENKIKKKINWATFKVRIFVLFGFCRHQNHLCKRLFQKKKQLCLCHKSFLSRFIHFDFMNFQNEQQRMNQPVQKKICMKPNQTRSICMHMYVYVYAQNFNVPDRKIRHLQLWTKPNEIFTI